MVSIDIHSEAGKQTLEKIVPKLGRLNSTFVYSDGTKEAKRLSRSQLGDIMIMGKGRRRYGHLLFNDFYLNSVVSINIPDTSKKSDNQKWEEGWKKVVKRLQASGLWEDYRKGLEAGLDIGYDKIKEAYTLYWHPWAGTPEEHAEQNRKMKELDPRLVAIDKTDGHEYPNTDILWTMEHAPKIKKMYFGRWITQRVQEELAQALKEKKDYEYHITVSYDVSVHYSSEQNRMWYNEEYRNCGNGHYYLGLDATHAVFGEDD